MLCSSSGSFAYIGRDRNSGSLYLRYQTEFFCIGKFSAQKICTFDYASCPLPDFKLLKVSHIGWLLAISGWRLAISFCVFCVNCVNFFLQLRLLSPGDEMSRQPTENTRPYAFQISKAPLRGRRSASSPGVSTRKRIFRSITDSAFSIRFNR